MSYLDKLKLEARDNKSIVCFGLDPDIDALPEKYQKYGIMGFGKFLQDVFEEMHRRKVFAGAFKPNISCYVKHDEPRNNKFKGSNALDYVMTLIDNYMGSTPIILDYKRGDIGKTSKNYAYEGFENWHADAVTVHPYMGNDSVGPFIKYCNNNQRKGVYILGRTSNKGAKDFQDLGVLPLELEDSKIELYHYVGQKIVEWAENHPGVGVVVGATSPDELRILTSLFAVEEQNIPMLIPGVGAQGGSAKEVADVLREKHYDLRFARINSSSGLTHPWGSVPAPDNYASIVVDKLEALNQEINFK